MVNIAKRMRVLIPLIAIRNGPGAALLPASPAPQLVNVHLRYPSFGYYRDSMVLGSRVFWRRHLRRLKYHNPALPITIQHEDGNANSPMFLTIQFEHKDPEVLKAIPGSVGQLVLQPKRPEIKKRKGETFQDLTDEEKEALAREQSPNFREAPKPVPSKPKEATDLGASKETETETSAQEKTSSELLTSSTLTSLPDAPSDEVVQKAKSTGPGASSTPIYTRSITLGVRDRPQQAIWKWFKERTKVTHIPKPQEDREANAQIGRFDAKAKRDKRRVKKGMDALRKEREDLQRARGEAERMKAEAV